ncbi:MAG: tetratricopeptide repeat protein [Planctomycetes bacterium]|nr:tetratricopeptide repeat protein [Planctomycetota bacterium]
MNVFRNPCLTGSIAMLVMSGIASATSQQSVPLNQTPAEGEILDLPELVARVKPSVVTILTYDADGQPAGQGSGFFIAEDRIVTNLHVIQSANRAEIRLTSGAMFDIAGVLADDEGHDLALLQVDLTKNGSTLTIKPLRLADTIPKEGERIAVIGSPLGLEQTVSDGIVSAVREIPGFGTIIQMTAAISPGSSGSPVFNMRGEVIAVARSIVVDAQSLNFAVAIEHVAAMQAGKLRRLSEPDRQATEGSDEAEEEFARGLAAFLANDYQKALVHFRRVVEIKSDDADAHCALGAAYAMLRRYEDAIGAFKQAIRIKPDYADAHFFLGGAYGALGRYQDEIAACKQAIRVKPDYAEAHFFLGVAYSKLGQHTDAIAACEQAIRIKPDFTQAHFVLGVAYRELGRYQFEILAYTQAIRIDPDFAEAHYNLGMAYVELGRYQESIDAIKEAIRIKPDDAAAHYLLGAAYFKLGRNQDAIGAFKQAIRIKPEYAEAHFGIGAVYLTIGDKGSALDEYKVLKELDRDLANKLFNLIYK